MAVGDGGGGQAPQRGQGADAGRPSGEMRVRFGDAAAEVLSEWRKDPDTNTILRWVGDESKAGLGRSRTIEERYGKHAARAPASAGVYGAGRVL